ncbi:MAG: hypothetical protein EXX96DRAFT_617719 [Benjaminiella poitrasii]|nr:MAG: hypothetical protein EXX96DRAFT_617719 [Benjaminiella poitrasii]
MELVKVVSLESELILDARMLRAVEVKGINEPCTVYDVKQRLAKATSVSVEQQRIRSLGGKILTDSDDLVQNYFLNEGPIILNLTVRLIGGRMDNKTIEKESLK